MAKVKDWLITMEEDAEAMTEIKFLNKYGPTYHYVWRNHHVWEESQKKGNEPPEKDLHKLWEGGG